MPYYPEKKPEDSGEEQKQTKMTEKQIRLLRLSVAVFFCFSDSVWICPADPVLRRSERFPEHDPGTAADSQPGRTGNREYFPDARNYRTAIHITNCCAGKSDAGRNVSA